MIERYATTGQPTHTPDHAERDKRKPIATGKLCGVGDSNNPSAKMQAPQPIRAYRTDRVAKTNIRRRSLETGNALAAATKSAKRKRWRRDARNNQLQDACFLILSFK